MSASIKDKPRRDLRNSDMKQTLETQSESSAEITSAEGLTKDVFQLML